MTASKPHQLPTGVFTSRNAPICATGLSTAFDAIGQTVAPRQKHLWHLALAKLRTEDNSLVNDYAELLQVNLDVSGGTNWILQVSSIVSTRMERLKARQWHYKWRGKPKKFRDQFQRILQIVTAINSVSAAAGNIDPLHIGLPLAGISVILNNEIQQYAAVLDGCEAVATIIRRYSAIEDHYLSISASPSMPLNVQSAIIAVYAEVLRYQARVLQYLGRNTFSRMTRNMLRFDGWEELLSKVLRSDNACKELINVVESDNQAVRVKGIENALSALDIKLEAALEAAETKAAHLKEAIQLISDVPVHDSHNAIRTRLGSKYWNSGQWLLNDPMYLSWKESQDGIFWLQGAIGTGKSCLTSIVTESFLEDENVRLAFYYCSSSSSRNRPMDILRSILAQLISIPGRIESSILDDLPRTIVSDTHCLDNLPLALEHDSNAVLIIDAMDECADYIELLSVLGRLHNGTRLRLFFSSRPDIRIKDHFPKLSSLVITPEKSSQDMEAFIQCELELPERRLRSAMTEDLANRLERILLKRAGAMFRWVELQIEVFLSRRKPLRHPKDIMRALESLEINSSLPDLNKAYDHVYNNNTSSGFHDRYLAEKTLRWMMATYESMRLSELIEIVASDVNGVRDNNISPSLLLDLCCNFITEDDSGFVHFAHLSVRDYLQQRESSGTLEYSDEIIHAEAAMTCLSILTQTTLDIEFASLNYQFRPKATSEIKNIVKYQRNPGITNPQPVFARLQIYAFKFWPHHCDRARRLRFQKPLKRKFTEFMFSKSSKGVLRWLKLLEAWGGRIPPSVLHYDAGNYSDCISTPLNPIFIACIWKFPEVLLGLSAIGQTHLRRNSKPSEKSISSLSHDTDLGIPIYELKNKAGTSAFLLAAKNDRVAMMKTMLRMCTGASCCLSMTGEWDNTALHEAAAKGSMRVAAFLLNLGAEVNVQNAGGDTPLHFASENGHSGMIHLLIMHGANSSMRNYFGHSPMDLAEFRRHRNALQTLLSGTSLEES